MQLSRNFSGLALFILALTSAGMATPLAAPGDNEVATVSTVTAEESSPYIGSYEMMHWLATTDAKLNFVGKPLNPLSSRAAQDTLVFYCTTRIGDVCGGTCTVYYGGAQCIEVFGTNCIGAFGDATFCDGPECTGSCQSLANCGDPLLHHFCYTPDTRSILVPDA